MRSRAELQDWMRRGCPVAELCPVPVPVADFDPLELEPFKREGGGNCAIFRLCVNPRDGFLNAACTGCHADNWHHSIRLRWDSGGHWNGELPYYAARSMAAWMSDHARDREGVSMGDRAMAFLDIEPMTLVEIWIVARVYGSEVKRDGRQTVADSKGILCGFTTEPGIGLVNP
ncbi:hypothetical protein LCGC14_0820650 [marine sediment metagenome]|uniref:Uncharacterized protein n=1 Tax=marine sediment metagenome TaxID=412755 RepID=A0A0F9S3Z1_9ZZZZ